MASKYMEKMNIEQTYAQDYSDSQGHSARKIKRKKLSRQFTTSMLIFGIAMVIVITLTLGYRNLLSKEKAYQENIAELNNELKTLEETNKQMKNEMNNMDSKEFKEKIAREKLGMIKEDEILIKESVDGYTGRGTDVKEETSQAESEDGASDDYDESESYDQESSYDEEYYDENSYNEDSYNESSYDNESYDDESYNSYDEEYYE